MDSKHIKVVKFGGTSLANAENILKAKSIIESDSSRRFVVVSAPGKCIDFPRKITDLLIDAHAQLCFEDVCESCNKVFERFKQISYDLGVEISEEIERVREEIIINRCEYDFVVSRGEYLMAVLFARLLKYKFLDAAKYIVIRKNGLFDEEATKHKFESLTHGKYVMGGFYGSLKTGGVKTFARGGSDYSGAIAAVCLHAEMYENFTDTYGVQSANPAIVKNTRNLSEIDFTTLHGLSKGGASVIYTNCLPLLKRHAVTLKVDCTFDAGKKFTVVTAKKSAMPFFSITYENKQNISKDTAEIFCALNKIEFPINDLRELLHDTEVYLVEYKKSGFKLLAPVENLSKVVNLLHGVLESRLKDY